MRSVLLILLFPLLIHAQGEWIWGADDARTLTFSRSFKLVDNPVDTRLRVLAGRPQALKLIVPPAAATCGEAWGPTKPS